MITVQSKYAEIEKILQLKKKLYHDSIHNPCRISRGKAGWDLFKANRKLAAEQKLYVRLCDNAVSDEVLQGFLITQSINLPHE